MSVQTNPEHDRRVTPLGTWWEHEGAQRFATLAALASELKTDRASLRNWLSGKRDPQRAQRERLHAITQLDYYSPQAVHDRMAARPKKRNANSGTSQTSSHAPSAQRFSDWFNRQTTYATQFELAQAVGVSRGTVRNMMAGRSFPRSDEICEKLHAATGLDCFGPGREAARAEHEWSIPRRVKADRMAKYRAKHPKRDRADKGKPRPQRQHNVGDAALVRSLLLKGEPILLDPYNPKSRQIGRVSRSIEEIACDLGLGSKRETRVRSRLREIFGLSVVDKVAFAHGELLSTKWIPRLQERFGVPSSRQLAAKLGVEPRNLWNLGRRADERTLTADYAPKLLRGECGFLATLVGDRGKPAAHLKSVVPDLRDRLRAAKKGIDLLRDFQNLPASEQDLALNDLCAAAPEDAAARTILCWLPELLEWIARNQSSLKRKSKALAVLFVAHDYGLGKVWLVQSAAYSSKVTATNHETIWALVMSATAPLLVTRSKPHRARKPRKSVEQTSEYEEARQVFCLLPQVGDVMQDIRTCKAAYRGNRKRLEGIARNAGFTHEKEIAELIDSKTTEAAAERIDWSEEFMGKLRLRQFAK